MMEITAANVNVAQNNDEDDICAGLSKDTLSPLPALENLSISTESTEATSSNEDISSSEFNDCSSSISSQDSNNFVATGTFASRTVKRSVFSQYWKKTGQKPVQLRPIKPEDESRPQSEPSKVDQPASVSTIPPPLFDPNIASLSKADLLEDNDCDSDSDCQSFTQEEPKKSLDQVAANTASPGRRRSILPPAPVANPALKSWSKSRSASFSHVESCSQSNRQLLANDVDSIPRRRSASSLHSQPGPSCLRPYQRYSLSRVSSSSLEGASTSRKLLRSDSSSSSVSFQEAVDIRHFEPPRESYAGKGWSELFY